MDGPQEPFPDQLEKSRLFAKEKKANIFLKSVDTLVALQ
jgi:hypothetical protein